MSDQIRYDRYGWDYPLVNPPDARAPEWYRRHARETGSPVLEVACGTGPVLSALAVDGHEVWGLDLSETMLDLARRRLDGLPVDVAGRVHLVQGDMRDFDLSRRFALAIVADNSLREPSTLAGVRSCLQCLRRHLRPGGRLLVTERRFDPSRYAGGEATWAESEPFVHPVSGEMVRRRIRVRYDSRTQRIRGVMTYRTTHADGSEEVEDCVFEGPVLSPEAYLALFADAGFDVRLCVGYEDRPDDGQDPWLCFVGRVTV